MSSGFPRLWGWPVLFGVLTASGLLSALVADGWGDAWSWFALGLPAFVCIKSIWPRRSQPRSPKP